jgi:GNAT superfamily N-acetyltransferase
MSDSLPTRAAHPDDAEELAALLAELGYPDNEPDAVRHRLATWGDGGHGRVLVADDGGRVAGVVAVAMLPYFERDGCWARIVAIVVGEAWRGMGVGRLLIEAAEEAARERGCVAMEVTTARYRVRAREFYRTLGFEDRCDRSARFIKTL